MAAPIDLYQRSLIRTHAQMGAWVLINDRWYHTVPDEADTRCFHLTGNFLTVAKSTSGGLPTFAAT